MPELIIHRPHEPRDGRIDVLHEGLEAAVHLPQRLAPVLGEQALDRALQGLLPLPHLLLENGDFLFVGALLFGLRRVLLFVAVCFGVMDGYGEKGGYRVIRTF